MSNWQEISSIVFTGKQEFFLYSTLFIHHIGYKAKKVVLPELEMLNFFNVENHQISNEWFLVCGVNTLLFAICIIANNLNKKRSLRFTFHTKQGILLTLITISCCYSFCVYYSQSYVYLLNVTSHLNWLMLYTTNVLINSFAFIIFFNNFKKRYVSFTIIVCSLGTVILSLKNAQIVALYWFWIYKYSTSSDSTILKVCLALYAYSLIAIIIICLMQCIYCFRFLHCTNDNQFTLSYIGFFDENNEIIIIIM